MKAATNLIGSSQPSSARVSNVGGAGGPQGLQPLKQSQLRLAHEVIDKIIYVDTYQSVLMPLNNYHRRGKQNKTKTRVMPSLCYSVVEQ